MKDSLLQREKGEEDFVAEHAQYLGGGGGGGDGGAVCGVDL